MKLFKQNRAPKSIKLQIEQYLKNQEFVYQIQEENEEKSIIHLGFNLETGNINTYIVINQSVKVVEIISYLQVNVPFNKRLEVSKFLDMIQSTYYLGNFQLNHKNGQLSTKTYFVYGKEEISQGIIATNLRVGTSLMIDDSLHGIMKICFGNKDAESVFAEHTNALDVRLN
jgi:hypothetical protein